MTSSEGVALQVDDVYVPLGLVERKKQSKPQGDISPEQGSELYKETEITKTFEHDAFLEQVLKQKNTPKSQGKRIAIIGEPGAGKTTLLQQIADWVSREIHQSIVIWASLADLRDKELKSYLFDIWLTQVAEKTGKAEATKQLRDDLVTLFNENNVWLLLDGLDEMSASNPLTEIARQFREAGFIYQARIVLTCRVNLWDGSINALDDFDTYRSLDFSYPEQVEKFIHKRFAAIPETGKQLCTALKESGKERIQDLVKNPLRLTLLCLSWQSGDGKLPDTQAGLYQQFVDDFYKWKKEEFATNSLQRQELNAKLGELAKAAIDKEATRFRLRQDFVSQLLGDADDENSLLKLALNRGWLNCVGRDTNRKPVYAFFHASFQEYFAAIAIDHWHFFLKHVPKNPSQGTYRIFEPQWKQTILLWLGRPEENLKQQKQEFIGALVNFKDRCGKWNREDVDKGFYEYRAYFLAAAGIAEFRDDSIAYEIVAQIIKWGFGYFNTKKHKWIKFLYLIQQEARSALQQTDRTKAIAALVQLLQLQDVNDDRRRQVAESLGKIDPGNNIAIASLVKLLQSTDVDDRTRWQAIYSLREIDPDNNIAITSLVKLLQSTDVDDNTRMQAAESLGKIGTANQQAITALVQILKSNKISHPIYHSAMLRLEKIGIGNKQAITALLQLLQSNVMNDQNHHMIAQSLNKIGIDSEIAITVLLQLLQSKEVNDKIRRLAAKSLGQIGINNKKAIVTLVNLLESTKVDNFTHRLAAKSLGQIEPGNSQAITCLENLLMTREFDDKTRFRIAKSLGQIDSGNSQAITCLENLLTTTEFDDKTRFLTAKSLGQIDPSNLQAIACLQNLLTSEEIDDKTRFLTAESLEQINPGNSQAITALVKLVNSDDVNKSVRSDAAKILGQIGSGNEQVIRIFIKILASNKVDLFTLTEITKSLKQIGTGNEEAITSLGKLLSSHQMDKYNHSLVIQSLTHILQDKQYAQFVIDFKNYLNHPQLFVSYNSGIWKCAQNMPYPNFYQAWHQHNVATRTMRSLKKILFTRRI